MNNNMNTTQRVTVSLPDYLYSQLVEQTLSRQLSGYIADAVEEKLLKTRFVQDKPFDSVFEFLELRRAMPKISDKKIFDAIQKGRM